MKVFLSIGMFLMFTISLYAAQGNVEEAYPDVYPKKIVFGTYSKKSSAKYELNTFRKDRVYKELYELALKNNFMIHYRPLAEYTILVIEPIHKRNVFFNALNLIRQKYPRAYHLSAEGLEEEREKPLPPLVGKSSKKVQKEPCVTSDTSANIEKPIFNVEEVSDEKMAVNCAPSVKKESPKTQKPETESKLQPENTFAANDMKQEPANAVQNEESKEKSAKMLQSEEMKQDVTKDAKPVQNSDMQKTESAKTDTKKEESFFASILSYFSSSDKKAEEKKPKAELKEVKKESKTVPEGMDVPALDEPVALTPDNEDTQMPKTSSLNDVDTLDETDALDIDDEENMDVKNDLNTTQKNIDETKSEELEDAKYRVKNVEDENLTNVTKGSDIDKNMVEVLKKEPPKEEKSYFTFSNIIIVLFLIFSPYLYRKFRKLKTVYDQY